MRAVAAYSLESTSSSTNSENVVGLIWRWLEGKHQNLRCSHDRNEVVEIQLPGSQSVRLAWTRRQSGSRLATRWTLTERDDQRQFVTDIQLACQGESIAVFCRLLVGHSGQSLSPLSFVARCPAVIRQLLETRDQWTCNGDVVRGTPKRFSGKPGGTSLAKLILDATRRLPMVVVSEEESFLLHPDIHIKLSADVAGLASVCVMDDEAAWGLTQALGAEWSCFNGALRVYWPGVDRSRSPFDHPLWTASKMRGDLTDTEAAARRMRDQIRRLIMGTSALSLREPLLLLRVRDSLQNEHIESLRLLANDSASWEKIADEEAKKGAALADQVRVLEQELDSLRTDLENERLIRKALSTPQPSEEVEPERETPPRTVQEAVARARESLGDDLEFGEDVDRGVEGLASESASPDKILNWLSKLARCARLKRDGELGMSELHWLKQSGISVSPEGNLSAVEKRARTWRVGGSRRQFELHMKPREATSPDQCVRIYFDWDSSSKRFVVGWIGRHP